MKTLLSQRNARAFVLLSALAPVVFLVGGCGGGGSGPKSSDNTPTPTATFIGPPTTTPNFPTLVVPKTVLRLPNGELGVLNLKSTGKALEGQLRVFNTISTGNTLADGIYPVTGVLAAPTAFSISNNGLSVVGGPKAQKFTITGDLPAPGAIANGGFTFTQDKFVATGTLLSSRQIFLPDNSPYRPIGDLQFARAANNTTSPLPAAVTPTGPDAFDLIAAPGDGGQRASLDYDLRDNPVLANLRVQAKRMGGFSVVSNLDIDVDIRPTAPFVVGQTFSLNNSIQSGSDFASVGITTNGLGYSSDSGTATVRSITGNSVALDFRNVVLTPNANNFIPGNLTMNGSVEATGIGAFVLGQ